MPNCNLCGYPIAFARLANGKLCPTEPDGSSHFDKCSQRRAVIVKRYGKHFTRTGAASETGNEREEGYKYRGKDKYVQLDGVLIRGAEYRPPTHECPTPPWDECRCAV